MNSSDIVKSMPGQVLVREESFDADPNRGYPSDTGEVELF